MTTAAKKILRTNIIDGGTKAELFAQRPNLGPKWANGKTPDAPHFPVTTQVDTTSDEVDACLRVTTITDDSDTADSWKIEGTYYTFYENGLLRCIGRFKGVYNTRTHKGHLNVAIDS